MNVRLSLLLLVGALMVNGCAGDKGKELFETAQFEEKQSNKEHAIKLYEELLQRTPNSIEARTNLGVALAHEGRYDEAIQQYEQIVNLPGAPESATPASGLGMFTGSRTSGSAGSAKSTTSIKVR